MSFERMASQCGRIAMGLALPAMLMASSGVQAKGASPFAGFAGSWSGGGSVTLASGSRERVRCKANYSPQSDGLHISIDCASDSYKIQVSSNVAADESGNLSGDWDEATRGVSGSVQGRLVGPGQLQVNLGGSAYTIQLSFATRGSQQTVAMQVPGSDIRSAQVDLHRN